MDNAYVSGIALAGSAIGESASFATTWIATDVVRRLAKRAVKTCTFNCSRSVTFPAGQTIRRKFTMAGREAKSWRELCHAALEAKDPNELQEIVQELYMALKHEEQVRRDFRKVIRTTNSSGEFHN